MRQLKVFLCIALAAVLGSCGESGQKTAPAAANGKAPEAGSIVYVQMDSLVNNYDMFNDLRTEFEAKWQGVQNDLQNKGKVFQNEVNDFQNKINKGLMTRQEAEEKDRVLSNKQADLQKLGAQKQFEMEDEERVLLNKVMEAVTVYIQKYNEDKKYALILTTNAASKTVLAGEPSLDITQDVLEGINNEYVKSKGKKSAESKKEKDETK